MMLAVPKFIFAGQKTVKCVKKQTPRNVVEVAYCKSVLSLKNWNLFFFADLPESHKSCVYSA